ncbi:coenzyme F420-0:L-glutamate ligase [Patescibacteria group bacterium]|nr:coenzyme F420-0:L-glutamate ligase [Patescibacteria group bacterium]
MKVQPIKTKLFQEGDSLPDFVIKNVSRIKDEAILVITSKIVSLSEGRTASPKEKERLIKKESTWTKKVKQVWLTERDGILQANAGIDESNGNGKIILLPKDSYQSAARLRAALKRKYKIKKLGVIIVDSEPIPRRKGVIGIALGYAGFKGVKDYKGKKDLFGRKFKFSSSNIADSLATTAMLTMGEGSERQPLAIILNAPVVFTEKTSKTEIVMQQKDDMFQLQKPLRQTP